MNIVFMAVCVLVGLLAAFVGLLYLGMVLSWMFYMVCSWLE